MEDNDVYIHARYHEEDLQRLRGFRPIDMCKAMEDMRNVALERGRTEGHLNTLVESVRNLKAKLGFSDLQAKETLNISNEDWQQIAVRI